MPSEIFSNVPRSQFFLVCTQCYRRLAIIKTIFTLQAVSWNISAELHSHNSLRLRNHEVRRLSFCFGFKYSSPGLSIGESCIFLIPHYIYGQEQVYNNLSPLIHLVVFELWRCRQALRLTRQYALFYLQGQHGLSVLFYRFDNVDNVFSFPSTIADIQRNNNS